MPDTRAGIDRALPVGSVGPLASGWWGMCSVIATEAALFAYLLFSYAYVAMQASFPWPTGGPPKLAIAGSDTVILLAASATVWWGERGIRRGHRRRLVLGLGATLVLGAVFLGLQLEEWRRKPFSLSSDVYGSLYFTVTGFHMAHVLVGLLLLLVLLAWTVLGEFDRDRHAAVSIGALYWHFVTAVWLAVFCTLYLSPYLGLSR